MSSPRKDWPLLVVGAGPCGLAVGVAARQAGIDCVLFDRASVVSAINNYPTHMTFFSTAERIELGGVPFTSVADKPTRREALKYYQRIVQHFQLDVRQYENVEAVTSSSQTEEAGRFEVHTLRRNGETGEYRADRLVIATGYLDSPCWLGAPGEDLPKVTHYYREGSPYFDQKCVVIGAGNSAVDAALDLYRWGAHVTLVHFADVLDAGVKPWILPDITNRLKNREIDVRWRSRVVAIHPSSVLIRSEQTGALEEIPNDWVFAMTGYRPDPTLLQSLGVEIDGRTGIPCHDPATMQTNRPGVYIAGVLAAGFNANQIFIENGREHGARIVADILG